MKSTNKESLISIEDYTFYEDKRIWSKTKGIFLKGTVMKDGYVEVFLKCIDGKRRNFLWHRVIWFMFNGEIPEGYEINHLDENKQNNALSNLSLTSHVENCNWKSRNERIAAKQKGVPKSEEQKRKISESCKGRKLSEEHKRKIGAKSRGRKHSKEEIEKRVAKLRGRKLSEEQKAKISKAVVAVKDGVIVMEFPSMNEAGRNGFDFSTIAKICRHMLGYKTHKSYQWFYKDEWLQMQKQIASPNKREDAIQLKLNLV